LKGGKADLPGPARQLKGGKADLPGPARQLKGGPARQASLAN
jgi:hypothetical protein